MRRSSDSVSGADFLAWWATRCSTAALERMPQRTRTTPWLAAPRQSAMHSEEPTQDLDPSLFSAPISHQRPPAAPPRAVGWRGLLPSTAAPQSAPAGAPPALPHRSIKPKTHNTLPYIDSGRNGPVEHTPPPAAARAVQLPQAHAARTRRNRQHATRQDVQPNLHRPSTFTTLYPMGEPPIPRSAPPSSPSRPARWCSPRRTRRRGRRHRTAHTRQRHGKLHMPTTLTPLAPPRTGYTHLRQPQPPPRRPLPKLTATCTPQLDPEARNMTKPGAKHLLQLTIPAPSTYSPARHGAQRKAAACLSPQAISAALQHHAPVPRPTPHSQAHHGRLTASCTTPNTAQTTFPRPLTTRTATRPESPRPPVQRQRQRQRHPLPPLYCTTVPRKRETALATL